MAKIGINLSSGEVNDAEQKELIIGIDLGTTNSLVAYTKNGEALTVKDHTGKNSLIPSVIHFETAEKVLVGDAAKEKLISDPANTIYSVKRLMGKSFKDVDEYEKYFGYKSVSNQLRVMGLFLRKKRKKFYVT